MKYFQEYEKLKAANQLLTSGSIWRDDNNNYKTNSLYHIVSNKRKSPHKDILRILKLTSGST